MKKYKLKRFQINEQMDNDFDFIGNVFFKKFGFKPTNTELLRFSLATTKEIAPNMARKRKKKRKYEVEW